MENPKEYDIISDLTNIETIAVGNRIRELAELQQEYGRGRWRKLKGVALVRSVKSGFVYLAEVHYYEAHGIGKRRPKVKRLLERRQG
jgi:hypothetical protein